MKTYLVLLLLVCFFPVNSAYAESEEEKKFNGQTILMANTFSDCAGLTNALAWIAEQQHEDDQIEHFHNVANGWLVTSAYFIVERGLIKNITNAVEFSRGMARKPEEDFKIAYIKDHAVAGRKINAAATICKKYAPYQVKVTDRLKQYLKEQKK